MIEVLGLFFLYRYLAQMLERKRRSPYLAYLCFPFCLLGQILTFVLMGRALRALLPAYGLSLLGLAFGALIMVGLVRGMSATILTCPGCGETLHLSQEKTLAKTQCLSCGLDLKVVGDQVTEARLGSRPKKPLPRVCPACAKKVKATGAVACASCLTPHHEDCWQARGACHSCGENWLYSRVEDTAPKAAALVDKAPGAAKPRKLVAPRRRGRAAKRS